MVEVMPEQVRNWNSVFIAAWIQNHEKDYAKLNLEEVLNEVNEAHGGYYLWNPFSRNIELMRGEHLWNQELWMSNLCYQDIYLKIAEKTDNPGYAYGMGKESAATRKDLRIFGPLLGVQKIVERIPKDNQNKNRTKEAIVLLNEPDHFIVGFQHKPGIVVSQPAIDYHLGLFDGFAEVAEQVGLETRLRDGKGIPFFGKPEPEGVYFECEGFPHKSNPAKRIFYHAVVKNIPEYRRNLDIARDNAIKHREEKVRVKIQKEKEERIRLRAQKYVPEEAVDDIVINDREPTLYFNEESLSTMFTDIRDFTTISESLERGVLAHLLRDYFKRIVGTIRSYGGHVDKYIGENRQKGAGVRNKAQHPRALLDKPQLGGKGKNREEQRKNPRMLQGRNLARCGGNRLPPRILREQ